MNITLSRYFLGILMFLICPVLRRDHECNVYTASQLFQSSLFFQIQEYNLLTRNGCIAVAIAKDIVAERDQTTARNKSLKFSHCYQYYLCIFYSWRFPELVNSQLHRYRLVLPLACTIQLKVMHISSLFLMALFTSFYSA